MAKPILPRKVKTFRIEMDINERLLEVAKRTNLSESWMINDALKKRLPEYERMAKNTPTQPA